MTESSRFDIRKQYLQYLRLPDLDNNMEADAILEAILFRYHIVFQKLSASEPDDDEYGNDLQHIAKLSLCAAELLATPFGEPILPKLKTFAEVASDCHAKVEVIERTVGDVLNDFIAHDALAQLDSAADPVTGLNENTKHKWKSELTDLAGRINGGTPHPWERALRVLIQRRINRLARELKPYSTIVDEKESSHLLASVRDMVAWEKLEEFVYDDRVEFTAYVYPLISLSFGPEGRRIAHHPVLYRLEVDLDSYTALEVTPKFNVKAGHMVDLTVSVTPCLGRRQVSPENQDEGRHDLWEPLDMPQERVVTLTVRQEPQADKGQPNTRIKNPFSSSYNGTPKTINRLKRLISVKAVVMTPLGPLQSKPLVLYLESPPS